MGDGVEQVVDARTLHQVDLPERIQRQAFGVRLQVNNLTDEPLRITRDNNENRLGSYDVYGRRALLDFTFKF